MANVGRKLMHASISVHLLTACVLLIFPMACANRAPVHQDRPAVELQLQNSVTLAVGRYASVFKALERGETNHVKDDLDWWVDQSIHRTTND